MLQKLEQAGVQIWVDTSGQALEIAAQTQSIHLKINDDEAGKLLDCKITSVNEAKEAAYTLQDSTKASVVITLAAAGAVMVSDARCWHARPPAIDIVSAVGSGDSFLAGFLTAIEKSLSAGDALKYGAAAGAANALSVGGARFEKSSFESLLSRIELQEL
jgi:fructose-1-phosphate kinase PfkB-like protein